MSIYKFCEDGDLLAVKQLLDKIKEIIGEVDVTLYDKLFQTAASHGRFDITDHLMSKISERTRFWTAFNVIDDKSIPDKLRASIIKYLIPRVDDCIGVINLTDVNNLMENAASRGQIDVVKYFNGIGVPLRKTHLRLACQSKNRDLVKYLNKEGIDATAGLSSACFWGDLPMLKFLLELGADLSGNRHLHTFEAVMRQQTEMLRYMINANIDLEKVLDSTKSIYFTRRETDTKFLIGIILKERSKLILFLLLCRSRAIHKDLIQNVINQSNPFKYFGRCIEILQNIKSHK